MKNGMPRLGLMLLIIGVIGILVAVVLPNFFRSRRCSAAEACIANMKQLEGAREQALLANSSSSIKGSPATRSTATVHPVYGPVAPTKAFDDCPGQPISDSAPVHSVYK